MRQALILSLLLLTACGSLQFPEFPKDLTNVTYKHDLVVEINNQKFRGTGVAPRAKSYHMKISPEERITRIAWNSCHQGDVVDKPDTGWFRKSYEFDLKEVPGVQDVYACALEISTINQEKRETDFATIEFLDTRPEVSLKAFLKCNGNMTMYENGVSMCQSAAGLIEQITFYEPVIQKGAKPGCDVMKSKDDMTFTFIMPKGKCTYYFGSERLLNGTNYLHRLETIGYTDVPVR